MHQPLPSNQPSQAGYYSGHSGTAVKLRGDTPGNMAVRSKNEMKLCWHIYVLLDDHEFLQRYR